MKSIYILCLTLFSLSLSAQTYVTVEPQTGTSRLALSFTAGRNIPYSVENYKITYNTTDVFGQPTVASGLLCVPADRGRLFALAVYNHGTVAGRELVPSREGITERFIPQVMAGVGMITVAPDYLGLGDNDAPVHPYVHADSEASAGRDLVAAAKQWLDEEEIDYSDQFFITGYSQGGHATQALHRDVQTNPGPDSLKVTAATHLSGPYSISDVMRETLFAEGQATLPGYIVYTYISYDYVYDLFDDFNEIFADEYVGNVDSFARGLIDLGAFNTRLEEQIAENNASLADLLQDSIATQLMTADPTSPTYQALLDNDTYDWAPEAPTLMYYCTADEQVPFRNAVLADSVMTANGSTSVDLRDGGNLTHGGCLLPALNATLDFFIPLLDLQVVGLGDVVDLPEVRLSPNPVALGSRLRLSGLPQREYAFVLYDQTGRETGHGVTSATGELQVPTSLTPGMQILRVQLADGTSLVRRFFTK
ncbi:S9 family peptidase [Lewinella sp. 4G2]|uniref:alpha/beta hydrolase family protein n=1 Tax=Lewinella sp. 4G2 TaxID=1803372 RepID=UPI0007B4D8F7|nr:prolyl oligopeptidase family serine peptidase [Lewinella sp. 4G2]OAV44199.1 hypothetical protein A3850_006690 [Lewinella sp. 4G2]